MKKHFLSLVLFSAVAVQAYGGERSSPETTCENQHDGKVRPIEFADPHIFVENDTYYLYGTGGKDGFLVYVSDDLENWQGPAGASDGYALMKGDSFGTRGFWAPQVFRYDGCYYMVYTADEQIAIARSDSPLGPFRQEQAKKISGEGRQIDPYIYFEGDKIYFYHVRLQEGNKLFVAEMEPDLSDIRAETVQFCFEALPDTWEDTRNAEWRVAEGPTVLKRGDRYFFIYSANDFRNPDYAVGYAVSDSPGGVWAKYEGNPILDSTIAGCNGTGHGDIFTDREGNLKYVFHYHATDSRVDPRRTAIIDAAFVPDGNGGEILRFDPGSMRRLYISE